MRWSARVLMGWLLACSAAGVQAQGPTDGGPWHRGLLDRFTTDELEEGRPDAEDPEAAWPNIGDPGPDLANFPNAAFTIPKGAFHVEFAPFSLYGPDNETGPLYDTEYLLRYGLTDRVELRLFGEGYQSFYRGRPQSPAVSGFAPIAFDLKVNFWSQPEDVLWWPSVGLEAYVQTEFASRKLRQGTLPGLILLFDHALPGGFQFEWNVGANAVPVNANPGGDAVEWDLQWAFQRRFVGRLDIFTHGFLNGSALPREADGIMVGGGAIYSLTKRLSLFGSYNAGLTDDAPTTFAQLGFALAF